MDKGFKSSFIFDLVNEFKIFRASNEPNIFEDDAYDLFCEKYRALSIQRDMELDAYLRNTPNLFRAHLPHSKWSLYYASQLVWYYDELIIVDPVLQHINHDLKDKEQKKYRLQELLSALLKMREAIEGGYLLFSGDAITPNKTGLFDDDSKIIIELQEVSEAFERLTLMMKKPTPINDDPFDNLTQLRLSYNGLWNEIGSMVMHVPSHVKGTNKLGNSVMFDFLTPYERMTKKDLIDLGRADLLAGIRSEYCNDIVTVLDAITNAQRLNSPLLFFRDVDCMVACSYSSKGYNMADTSIYNCMLPYIEDVPPERLFALREQMPMAFLEFRAFLFDLVSRTMKVTADPAEFKFRIESELNSLLRKLGVEMGNLKRKKFLQGIASPLSILMGSFGLFSSGLDYLQIASTFIGSRGIDKAVTTWDDAISEQKKATLNPVYFLWNATKS